MKNKLLLGFIFTCYTLSGVAKQNTQLDTNQIKPVEILKTNANYVEGWDKKNFQKDYYRHLFEIRAFGIDTYKGLTVQIKSTEHNAIYHLYLNNIQTGKMEFISNNWVKDQKDESASLFIDVKYFKDASAYQLLVVPVVISDNKKIMLMNKSVKVRNAYAYFVATHDIAERRKVIVNSIFIVIIIFSLIRIPIGIKKLKLAKATQAKEKAQLQLDAVRSQLNPHFLFNALAGIQNLMNNNETENANRYLTKFARLTRAVLKNNDLISIEDEIGLLDDYLQMEQLRFNFRYSIQLDPQLNQSNNEIPSMLLQPFIENAVKHGVAGLGNNGSIDISVAREENNITISIQDNGKGFNTSKAYKGLGFDLSTKRISLLNKIYKESPIHLQMKSEPGKTVVIIILTNWL